LSNARDSDWECARCGRAPEKIDGYVRLAPQFAEDTTGFDAGFFSRLFGVEDGSFWFVGRSALIVWALRKYFGSAKNLLEVGCGTGYVLACLHDAFPRLHLSGSEVLAAGLPYASSRRTGAELLQMDARTIPFESEFDVVCAFDVIEHIVEDEDVLAQMYRAVKPGGGIMLTVPQHRWLWSRTDDYARHERRYSRRELVDKVQAAGFSVRRVASFVSLLMPLMIASRALEGLRATAIDTHGEFRLPAWTNAVLRAALDFERRLIALGVSFPLGGSLLLVAQRPDT
jgi:SAM-dependent methyltransferase